MTASKMYSPSASDWAWLAGILDGEGHIQAVQRRKGVIGLSRRIAITNCNLPLLIQIATLFGGQIHPHTPPPIGHRQQFQWYCYGDRMRWILEGTLSRLVAKKGEAEVCLAFDRVRMFQHGHTLTPEALVAYQRLLADMQVLRQASWTPADVPQAFTSRGRVRGEDLPGYTRYCPSGHPYDAENTKRTKQGNRRCRACCKAAEQRRQVKRRAAVVMV